MIETHITADAKYHLTNDLTERKLFGEALVFFRNLEKDEEIRQVYTNLYNYIAAPGAESGVTQMQLVAYLIKLKKLKHRYKGSMLFDLIEAFGDSFKESVQKEFSISRFFNFFLKRKDKDIKGETLEKLCNKIYTTYAIRAIQSEDQDRYRKLATDFSETMAAGKIGFNSGKANSFLETLKLETVHIRNCDYVSLIKRSIKQSDVAKKAILLQVGYSLLKDEIVALKKQSETKIDFLKFSALLKKISILKIHTFGNSEITKKLEKFEKYILKTRVGVAENFMLSAIKELEAIHKANSGGWNRFKLRVRSVFSSSVILLSEEQLVTCSNSVGNLYKCYSTLQSSNSLDKLPSYMMEILAPLQMQNNHPVVLSRLKALTLSIARVQLLSGFPAENSRFLSQITVDPLLHKLVTLESVVPRLAGTFRSCSAMLSSFPAAQIGKKQEMLSNVLTHIAMCRGATRDLPSAAKDLLNEVNIACVALFGSVEMTCINQEAIAARKKAEAGVIRTISTTVVGGASVASTKASTVVSSAARSVAGSIASGVYDVGSSAYSKASSVCNGFYNFFGSSTSSPVAPSTIPPTVPPPTVLVTPPPG